METTTKLTLSNHRASYRPCDLYGGGTEDHGVVQPHDNLTELLLHLSVIHTLRWRTYIWTDTKIGNAIKYSTLKLVNCWPV